MSTTHELKIIEELRKALSEVWDKKHGQNDPHKDKIIQKVIESIPRETLKNINPKEVKDWKHNPIMEKILNHALVGGKLLFHNPNLKLDLGLLFKKSFSKAQEKELTKLLDKLNKLILKDGDKLLVKDIKKNAEKHPELKTDKTLNHGLAHEDPHEHNKTLLGVDPTTTGSVQIVVQTAVVNQTGIADLRPELKEDNLSRDSGIDNPHEVAANEENSQASTYHSPNPFSTTLKRE